MIVHLCALQIEVAHFEPDVIRFIGTASYPRLSLNVPRPIIDATDLDQHGELKRVTIQKMAEGEMMDSPTHFNDVCNFLDIY